MHPNLVVIVFHYKYKNKSTKQKEKKPTHIWRRWGTPQNFFLTVIDELEKQLFIKKLLKLANNNQNNFNIYNVAIFFKKIQKITWRYFYFTPVYQIPQRYDLQFQDIVRDRLKLVVLGHFLPFYSPKNSKYHNFDKMKKIAGDIVILLMCTKNSKSYDNKNFFVSLRISGTSWDTEWDTKPFVILGHFLPFYLANDPEKQKFEKMKKIPGDIIILHMCTKDYNHMVYSSWDMLRDRQVDGPTKKLTYRCGCPT